MEYKRICPKCGKDIWHKSKYSRNSCHRKQRPCRSCSSVNKNKKFGNNKKFIERYATKGKNNGKDNAFFGRKHTEETKKKLKKMDRAYAKTEKFRKKMIAVVARGKDSPMYGKNVYGIWVEKYGKEEADRRDKIRREKMSKASIGKKNSMYGKQSPQGSGNGWSGWYKGWFFRSLKELSYMVKVIEKNNQQWRTAEDKDLRIKYIDYKGNERTYVSDFFVEEKYLIEIKPEKLKNSLTVRLKKEAAEKFCKEKGFIYKIESVDTLSVQEIKKMYDLKIIKFTNRYERKYHERYNN